MANWPAVYRGRSWRDRRYWV